MLYLDPADLSVSGPPKMALNTHYVLLFFIKSADFLTIFNFSDQNKFVIIIKFHG